MGFTASASRLAGLSGAVLGWRPDDFWAVTPAELATILTAFAEDGPGAVPAARSDLSALMEQFPDG
ncbi:MAG: phage tail assembly chaperone [Pseudomonadota bacterium]